MRVLLGLVMMMLLGLMVLGLMVVINMMILMLGMLFRWRVRLVGKLLLGILHIAMRRGW